MQAKGAEAMKLFFKASGMKKEYAAEHIGAAGASPCTTAPRSAQRRTGPGI